MQRLYPLAQRFFFFYLFFNYYQFIFVIFIHFCYLFIFYYSFLKNYEQYLIFLVFILKSKTQLSSLISVPTNWGTCESVGVSSCNGEDPFQRYLKCFVDLWHRCESQEDCENSGHCADRFWTTIVRNAEHPIDVQFGACFTSGEFFTAYRDPYCLVSEDRPGIGCRDRLVGTPEECLTALNVWRTWLTPAMSETECRNKNVSRYGCQQPGIEKHLVWLGDEECDCRGGVSDYAWEWTQGVWRDSGVSRTLHWREVEPIQKYQWTPALSFELLQNVVGSERRTEIFFCGEIRSDL